MVPSLSRYLLQNPRKVANDAQSGYLAATYAYARNNPFSVSDPDGNWRWEFRTQTLGHQVPAYGYALNNPVTVVDPSGKNPLLLLLCAGGGCEAAAAGALAATTYVVAAATAIAGGIYCGSTGNCFGTPTVPVSALPGLPRVAELPAVPGAPSLAMD